MYPPTLLSLPHPTFHASRALQGSLCYIAASYKLWAYMGFLGGSNGKESACNEGDSGLIPGLGRSPGDGNGNPPQYFCLGNPMDRGAWQAVVHEVSKSQTHLSDFENEWVYIHQCYFLNLSYPLLPPPCPQVHSLHLHLHFFSVNRFISTVFLDSVSMCGACMLSHFGCDFGHIDPIDCSLP